VDAGKASGPVTDLVHEARGIDQLGGKINFEAIVSVVDFQAKTLARRFRLAPELAVVLAERALDAGCPR
jgi:hypothetical protein